MVNITIESIRGQFVFNCPVNNHIHLTRSTASMTRIKQLGKDEWRQNYRDTIVSQYLRSFLSCLKPIPHISHTLSINKFPKVFIACNFKTSGFINHKAVCSYYDDFPQSFSSPCCLLFHLVEVWMKDCIDQPPVVNEKEVYFMFQVFILSHYHP